MTQECFDTVAEGVNVRMAVPGTVPSARSRRRMRTETLFTPFKHKHGRCVLRSLTQKLRAPALPLRSKRPVSQNLSLLVQLAVTSAALGLGAVCTLQDSGPWPRRKKLPGSPSVLRRCELTFWLRN